MDYQAAMDYIAELTKFGFNFGLGRIEELLRRLDNPHRQLRIVHVGGTNGKGSTTAMLASILRFSGYRVGTFTSPHLHAYTERFRINGAEIDRRKLAGLIAGLRPHLEEMVAGGFEHPTEFEVSTAIAFQYFNQEKVDFLVLEVGLGGAVDSTNVAMPLVSVITNVAVDHTDYLGETICEIARVKSGIIKPCIPAVTAAAGEALEIIEAACLDKDSPLTVVGRDITFEQISASPSGQQFQVWGRRAAYNDLRLSLLGRHQQVNAATAIAAIELLADQGINIDSAAMREGLAATRWPARLELFGGEPPVLIDGAHNFESARSLRQALWEYFPGRGLVLLIGMLDDKERGLVAAELAPAARAAVVTRPDSPRAGHWQGLAREVGRYIREVYLVEDIKEAFEQALSLAQPGELLCVTGSLYMVGRVREFIIKARGN